MAYRYGPERHAPAPCKNHLSSGCFKRRLRNKRYKHAQAKKSPGVSFMQAVQRKQNHCASCHSRKPAKKLQLWLCQKYRQSNYNWRQKAKPGETAMPSQLEQTSGHRKSQNIICKMRFGKMNPVSRNHSPNVPRHNAMPLVHQQRPEFWP